MGHTNRELTIDLPVHNVQSTTKTTKSSGEQSSSVMDTQLTGNKSHGTWGIKASKNSKTMMRQSTGNLTPDLDYPDTQVQKLSPTTIKIVEDTFSCSIPNDKTSESEEETANPRHSLHKVSKT